MIALLLWPFLGAPFAPATLAWGAASGVAPTAAGLPVPAGTVLLVRSVLAERTTAAR